MTTTDMTTGVQNNSFEFFDLIFDCTWLLDLALLFLVGLLTFLGRRGCVVDVVRASSGGGGGRSPEKLIYVHIYY